MREKNKVILFTAGFISLLFMNLYAGNETPTSTIIQIEISKNGQVFISDKFVQMEEIEQIGKDILKETPNVIFRISRSIETTQEVFLAVLDKLKKADAKKVIVAVPTDE